MTVPPGPSAVAGRVVGRISRTVPFAVGRTVVLADVVARELALRPDRIDEAVDDVFRMGRADADDAEHHADDQRE